MKGPKIRSGLILLVITSLASVIIFPVSCTKEGVTIDLDGQVINVTFLHTSDIHSRLLPYYMTVSGTDRKLGLKQENAPFGGAARAAFILMREKAKADRVLHLDSGDIFQGAPIFNFFRGEPELRVLSAMGCDAAVIGNHEFDFGSDNLADQVKSWANFPMLAANYYFEDPKSTDIPPLGKVAVPFTTFNLKGLKVAVIGIGNTNSMTAIYETGNRHGITPMETVQTIQFFVDLLRPQSNLIVILSHLGLEEDELMIKGTTGIDLVLGGHLHIVLNPPKVLEDCQTEEVKKATNCSPRKVILAHSGAFLKFVARLDVAVKQSEEEPDDWEIFSHGYQLFPVDSTVPENPLVAEMLEPYVDKMKQLIDLDLIVGYSPGTVKRFSNTDGDSELGNLVATATWTRPGIETDFALTNTGGIRDNIYPGPVTLDAMYQVFPFDNTITTLFMSGREVVELFDYVARRTAARGCNSQAQIAGARVVLKCGYCTESYIAKRPSNWPKPSPGACALSIQLGGKEVDPDMQYSLATNSYIAKGGSGYAVLKKNTTQQDTGVSQRDALIDFIRSGKPCGYDEEIGELKECTTDADCGDKMVCSCPERVFWDETEGTCKDVKKCEKGSCVLKACVNDISSIGFFAKDCSQMKEEAEKAKCKCTALRKSYSQCKEITCLDEKLGAAEDGRIKIIPP